MKRQLNHVFLPLGLGLLTIGIIFGLNLSKVFLAFIPCGLFFLFIVFMSKNKK